jgi:hypothetical protein
MGLPYEGAHRGEARDVGAKSPRLHQHVSERRGLDPAGENGHAAGVGGELAQ